MQMPIMIENDLNQIMGFPEKTPKNSGKIRQIQNRFENERNRIFSETGAKTATKTHNFGRVRFTANFEKCQKLKNEKSESLVLFLGWFLGPYFNRGKYSKFQKPNLNSLSPKSKTEEFKVSELLNKSKRNENDGTSGQFSNGKSM